jgi:hypothetical protein
MIGDNTQDSDPAARRLARFNARPEIQSIAARYADWAHGDGCIINVQLSALAMMRLARRISRADYRASLRKLAATSGLPHADFQLLAKCSREIARCMLSGSGQIPFTPWEWDREEGKM